MSTITLNNRVTSYSDSDAAFVSCTALPIEEKTLNVEEMTCQGRGGLDAETMLDIQVGITLILIAPTPLVAAVAIVGYALLEDEIKEEFPAAAEAVVDFIGDTVSEYEVMADNLFGGLLGARNRY